MTVGSSLLYSLALLLVLSGATKLRKPAATVVSLRILLPRRLPGVSPVRLIGSIEIATGICAIVVGGRLGAALITGAYLVLAAVSWRLAGNGADCGCFGAVRSPMTRTHVVVNVAFTVTAAASLIDPPWALQPILAGQPWAGLPYLAAVLGLTALCYLVFTALPALQQDRTLVES